MKTQLSLLSVLCSLVWFACGGSSGPGAAADGGASPTILAFNASPVTLPPSGGNVTLSWNVAGASRISIDEGVGDVTGISSNSKVVSVNASKQFHLTATNSAGSASQLAAVNVAATVNVSGRVLFDDHVPAGSIVISIPGKPAVTTDANGAFTVANVSPPYDVTLVESSTKFSVTYKGLTRSDPTLVFVYRSSSGTTRSANVSGTVSGGNYPQPLDHATRVIFSSPEAQDIASTNTGGAYAFAPVRWRGPVSTSGTLHAVQMRTFGGLPIEYKGYGKTNLSLSNGGTFINQDVTMSAVATGSVSGTITPASGYTLEARRIMIDLGGPQTTPLFGHISSAQSFNYLLPAISGASFTLAVDAINGGSYSRLIKPGLSASVSGLSFSLPAAPEQILPVNLATGVRNSTSFSWNPFPNGVHVAVFYSALPNPTYVVITGDNNATIPDLSGVGLGLPGGMAYHWLVEGVSPYPSVDSAAGSLGLDYSFDAKIETLTGRSVSRQFTTAP